MGHGKDHMEIAGVEEIALPCCDPALASLRLTLGAVAIATRVVGDGLIPAALAGIAMPAEGSGAAALNGSQGFELLEIQARSIAVEKAIWPWARRMSATSTAGRVMGSFYGGTDG